MNPFGIAPFLNKDFVYLTYGEQTKTQNKGLACGRLRAQNQTNI